MTKIRKTASIAKPYTFDKASSKQGEFSTSLSHSKAQDKTIARRLHDSFGIEVDLDNYAFVASQKTVFLTSPTILPYLNHARFEKVGIPIAKILTNKRTEEKDFIPLQHLANTLGHLATHHTISITPNQAQSYTEGETLDIDQMLEDRTYYLIHVDGLPFSLGKVIDGKIKNKFVGV
ncbi:MAG: hypothetical protein H6766_07935 [Candidatus Peribacteria bacterium]|nr:MAG: hypothetical protein H6766_07935 [Candidatus Peribacteria bacterium]